MYVCMYVCMYVYIYIYICIERERERERKREIEREREMYVASTRPRMLQRLLVANACTRASQPDSISMPWCAASISNVCVRTLQGHAHVREQVNV